MPQHRILPAFTADDPDDYEEDDEDDDDDDDEADNDDVEADDYIAVDEQGIGAGGSVMKMEEAAFVSCAGDFEIDTGRRTGQPEPLQGQPRYLKVTDTSSSNRSSSWSSKHITRSVRDPSRSIQYGSRASKLLEGHGDFKVK